MVYCFMTAHSQHPISPLLPRGANATKAVKKDAMLSKPLHYCWQQHIGSFLTVRKDFYVMKVFSDKFLKIKTSAYKSNQVHTLFPWPILTDSQISRFIAKTGEQFMHPDFFSKLFSCTIMPAIRDPFFTHTHTHTPFSHINGALHLTVPAIVAEETLRAAQLHAQSKLRNKSHCFSEQRSVRRSASEGESVMVDLYYRMSGEVSI